MAFGKVFSNITKLCCVTCRDPDSNKELVEMFKLTHSDPVLQTLGLLSFFSSKKLLCFSGPKQ